MLLRLGGTMIRYHLDQADKNRILAPSSRRKWKKQAPEQNISAQDTITAEDAAIMAQPHKPETFLICCIDSRFQPAKAFNYGPGVTLEHRPIACVIPPKEKADPDLLSRLAFRRINNIRNIILVCHSDCGGAQTALKVACSHATCNDMHEVALAVDRTGLDISKVGGKYLSSENGDVKKAGNLLAKEIGLKSLKNLLAYKGAGDHATIADEVAAGAAEIMLFYYDLEKLEFETYDAGKKEWHKTDHCDGFFSALTSAGQDAPKTMERPAPQRKRRYR